MSKDLVIYEAEKCCSCEACGPDTDQSLIELLDTLEKVKVMGAKVERYTMTQDPMKFRKNAEVIKLLQERKIQALPITTFDGKIIKIGMYPTLAELKELL